MVYNRTRNPYLYEDIFFSSESSKFLFNFVSMQKNITSMVVCFGAEKSIQKQQKLANVFLSFLTGKKPVCQSSNVKHSTPAAKNKVGVKNTVDYKLFLSNSVALYSQFFFFFSSSPFVFHRFLVNTVFYAVYVCNVAKFLNKNKNKCVSTVSLRNVFGIKVKNVFVIKKFRYFVELSSLISAFNVNFLYTVH